MTPLATVTSLEQASNTQWESLLFGRYQTALAVALGSGTFRDAQAALDAWDQWLLINQPDDSRRAAIPTPRVLQDILDREGKST